MSKSASAISSVEPSTEPTCLQGMHVMQSVGTSCYALYFTAHNRGANLHQHMEMYGRAYAVSMEKKGVNVGLGRM